MKRVLEFVSSVRWGRQHARRANFLFSADDAQRKVAAGNAGKATLAGDRYNLLVVI